jgi:DNA-binding transcriptional MerR regulator
MNYSIGEFSKITNLSAPTLRYYEKEQLLRVSRDSTKRRLYTSEDIAWLLFIKRLKDTGMPIKKIREYALLRYQGDSTLEQRLELLEKHRLAVSEEKSTWETNLLNLDEKIKTYKQKIAEKTGISL